MASNIELRGNVWFATLHVPKDVRDKIGKAKFFQSLKTSNKKIAYERAMLIVGEWKAQIALVRGTLDNSTIEALGLNRAIKQIETIDDQEALIFLADDRAEELAKKSDDDAKDFMDVATGKKTPLDPLLDDWIASISHLKPKTRVMFRSDTESLVKRFKYAENLTKRAVRIWVNELTLEKSSGTVKKLLTACSSFWKFLQSRDYVDIEKESPFHGFKFKSDGIHYKPFDPEDVVKLVELADVDDKPLASLIKLAAYTGARLEELCQLKVGDITQNNSFKIREAKTEAGIREVPIHNKIIGLVNNLKFESEDGYLIASTSKNKLSVRGAPMSKRFGRLRTKLGFGSEYVFHSLRKTVVTLLEQAQVSENLTADIVGHEKPRITYGLYSGGNTLEAKREALELIQYSFDV